MLFTNNGKFLKNNGLLLNEGSGPTPPVVNTYTAEYVGYAGGTHDLVNGSCINLSSKTYYVEYSAHFVLAQENRYNCYIEIGKEVEGEPSEYIHDIVPSYSALSDNTKTLDLSGTVSFDPNYGYNYIWFMRDGQNIAGRVSATITANNYV